MVCSLTISQAQEKVVTGTVTDANDGMGIPGVSVVVKGTTIGTSTDIDGYFTISADASSTLVFSFIGYKGQEILVGDQTQLNIVLSADVENLSEVVVIGYGQVKKGDATGAVTTVDADDINKTTITSPELMLSGKTAGVRVTSSGGAPGSGSSIRIRSGSSLNANNEPLIVIDGIPMDKGGVNGMRNPLNTINPNDIASFSILKDASSTAIYGSRASNGVIIITTKKGKAGDLKFEYNGNFSVSNLTDKIDVLSADEFRSIVNSKGNEAQKALLNNDVNTDWQDEIYQTGFGQDHNFSATGAIKNAPFRASIGYTDQTGILKTSDLKRYTASLGINPSFFDDHLKINVNAKGMYIDNRFAETGSVTGAVTMDPTKRVKSDDPRYSQYGGYFEWTEDPDGDGTYNLVSLASRNPVAELKLRNNEATAKRVIANTQFDYKFHFLPELRANMNIAIDYSDSEGDDRKAKTLASTKGFGDLSTSEQEKTNKLFDFYLNYVKEFENSPLTSLDVMGGYSYQNIENKGNNTDFDFANDRSTVDPYKDINNLQSFFGRVNLNLYEKFLLTFTYRADATSRFSKDNRWGKFPAAAFAWKVMEEDWLKNSEIISDLKMRLGWGVTGQQEVGGYYPSIPIYTLSNTTSQYKFGDGALITYRPDPYNSTLKWEETTTYNAGFDYGFFNNKVYGSVDVYFKETKDLLNRTFLPAGTNLSNVTDANIGSMENKGIEFAINALPVATADLTVNLGFNISYEKSVITKLTASNNKDFIDDGYGNISGGTGNKVQGLKVDEEPYFYYVYKQVYGNDGKPIEGLFEDLDGDGEITPDDRYIYKSARPDVYLGFNANINYKNWDFGFALRGTFGNYNYNNVNSNLAFYTSMVRYDNTLSNSVDYLQQTQLNNQTEEGYKSDMYVQNASFVKIDNISLGYTFKNLMQDKLSLRVFGSVSNVATFTKYDGLDPEVNDGIDYNLYPRPTTYSIGVKANF